MCFHVFKYWIKMNLGSYEKENNRLSLEFKFELICSSQAWTLIGFWVVTRIIQLCFVRYLLFWKVETQAYNSYANKRTQLYCFEAQKVSRNTKSELVQNSQQPRHYLGFWPISRVSNVQLLQDTMGWKANLILYNCFRNREFTIHMFSTSKPARNIRKKI
jgi:hypothetical protein